MRKALDGRDTLGPAKPYEEIEQLRAERDSLRAKLEKARDVLIILRNCAESNRQFFGDNYGWSCMGVYYADRDLDRINALIAELSADAPAQPSQTSDDVRSLLDEAIAALEKFESGESEIESRPHLLAVAFAEDFRHAKTTLTKLRAARNG